MAGTPNVAFIRREVANVYPEYRLIRDCLAGEARIKNAGIAYLPRPNPTDESKENEARYKAYVKRAVFYNVTRRTLGGLIGQIFMRDPIIKVPEILNPLVEDATGSGISLIQQAKKSCELTLAYSRSGLLIDYPNTGDKGVTAEEVATGVIRPVIRTYSPMEVINWRTETIGAETVISMVCLAEGYPFFDDGFEIKSAIQFRVLRLSGGMYTQEIWREKSPTEWSGLEVDQKRGREFIAHDSYIPKDPNGNTFDRIPFTFIGSQNNDTNVDLPNMYDLASLNVAHYRNSADYEESCYITGQPTIVVTGLTEEWLKNVLNGKVEFGSRGGIPLPADADAKLIQAEEKTMIKEAMDAKERQMIALGAKLIEQNETQRTAFETKVDATNSGSVLSNTAKNVTEAYRFAISWALKFSNLEGSAFEFQLNDDFDISRMTPEERGQAIKDWQAGAITFEEMRVAMRKAGIATEDDAKAKAQILEEQTAALKLENQFNNTPTGE